MATKKRRIIILKRRKRSIGLQYRLGYLCNPEIALESQLFQFTQRFWTQAWKWQLNLSKNVREERKKMQSLPCAQLWKTTITASCKEKLMCILGKSTTRPWMHVYASSILKVWTPDQFQECSSHCVTVQWIVLCGQAKSCALQMMSFPLQCPDQLQSPMNWMKARRIESKRWAWKTAKDMRMRRSRYFHYFHHLLPRHQHRKAQAKTSLREENLENGHPKQALQYPRREG